MQELDTYQLVLNSIAVGNEIVYCLYVSVVKGVRTLPTAEN